ncbi:histidine phosphatase family protein [Phycicoccus avicenniae]|uniref:histidine phosphatase family protein n=1 Tax=Phycicoccus avicenniae TaxID=2828860 RepID=UPI003D27D2A1
MLVRHPQPEGAAGRCYGRTDLAVDPGRAASAVAALRDRLTAGTGESPSHRTVRVVSSPLRRARVVAQLLADDLRLPIVVDPRFAEIDFGSWEGRFWKDIPRAELDQWAADLLRYRGHGGESVSDLATRVATGLGSCRPGDVVVSHLGVIRAALAHGGHPTPWTTVVPFGGVLGLRMSGVEGPSR